MNNLQIFKGNKVELLEFDNNILFNPYDVGACLELEKSSIKYYLKNMNTNQAILIKNSMVENLNFRKLNNTGEKFLTESGVYKLIFKSNKPKAEEFANWVTDEVLPNLRKSGSYNLNSNEQIIQRVLVNQQSIVEMIGQLAKTIENLTKTNIYSDNKVTNAEIEKLLKNQSSKPKYKIQMLPKEVKDVVDILLSQEDRNFSYISRYLYTKGYSMSNVAVSNYYYKVFRG